MWTQIGLGNFELCFLRDKERNEVDFLVTRDGLPWFLVEVKKSDTRTLSPSLGFFQSQIGAENAFQVVLDADFVDEDCFAHNAPLIVPAKTFLSQV